MKKLYNILVYLLIGTSVYAQQEMSNEQKAVKQALRAFLMINQASRQSGYRELENGTFMDESTSRLKQSSRDFYNNTTSNNYINDVNRLNSSYNSTYNYSRLNQITSPSSSSGTTYLPSPSTYYLPFNRPDRILDEAILILKDCEKLDPSSIVYPLHIGFAYYLENDYRRAIKTLMRLQYDPKATERVFQLLAKCYAKKKDDKNVIKTLEKGMATFPKSGILFQEQGLFYLQKKDTAAALASFEQGIFSQPSLSSLYEVMAFVHQWQNNLVESLMYTEIYMSMEPASPKFKTAAARMFNLATKIFSLNHLNIPRADSLTENGMAAQTTFIDSVVNHLLQAGYMDTTYATNRAVAKRLQQYKTDIVKKGFANEYLHWLLQQGDIYEFATWKMSSLDKWNAFGKWFNDYNGFAQQVERKKKGS